MLIPSYLLSDTEEKLEAWVIAHAALYSPEDWRQFMDGLLFLVERNTRAFLEAEREHLHQQLGRPSCS